MKPLPARNVSASPISTTELKVEWIAPSSGGFHQFDVYVRIGDDVHGRTSTMNESFTANVTGLIPGTFYDVFVDVIFFSVTSATAEQNQIPTIPDLVGNLTSPPTFPTNMTSISWSPPQFGSADYYRVTYTDSSGETFHNETTNQTSYELDVVYGEKYNVEVRSVFAGYQSDPESRETVISPLPVQSLQSSPINTTSIKVSWMLPSCGRFDQIVIYVNSSKIAVKNVTVGRVTDAVVSSLTPGTIYTIFVEVVSFKVTSEITIVDDIPTFPDRVNNLTSPPTFPTNMTSISWSPPQLGSADYYRVTYTDSSGETFHNETTNQTSYELDVVYGEKYNVEVRSVFAGYQSDPESREAIIFPDVVKNLNANQSNGNQTTQLDVTWNKPSGRGERINISYVGLSIASMNEVSVGFDDTTATLSVTPGNTYNITVSVISNGLESDSMVKMNAKPAQPLDLVSIPAIDNINVTWTPSDGFIAKYIIVALSNAMEQYRMDISKDDASHVISNLSPYTDYDINIYSIIVDVAGSDQESERSLISDRTLAAAPPSPPADAAEGFSSGQATTTSYTFVLPANTFSSDNGPIQYYAVFRTTSTDGGAPNVNGPLEPCDKAGVAECVAMWTDDLGNPATVLSGRKKRQAGNEQISFTLGNGEMTQSPFPGSPTYTNVALDPNTGYRVAVAAKTDNDELTVTPWSAVVQTVTPVDVGLIVGLVVACVVIVILLIVGFIYYRRTRGKRKDVPIQEMVLVTSMERTSKEVNLSEFMKLFHDLEDEEVSDAISEEYAVRPSAWTFAVCGPAMHPLL
ncbi:unnamed protein product [Clavelina lepadiformis]|uniref:Fibronectin type-III domain-containing protein n=1 Tax=Clavelina lepadiformis TaxID=159417 RepID=A0ABP0G1H2_CLALP